MRLHRIALGALAVVGIFAACDDGDLVFIEVTPDAGVDGAVVDAADEAAAPDATFDVGPVIVLGGDGGADADAAPSVAAVFCQNFLNAQLTTYTTCCPSDVGSPVVAAAADEQQFALIACTSFYETSLAAERVHYLPQMEKTCLANVTLAASDCPDGGGPGAAKTSLDCQAVFSGLQQQGDDCTGDQECADLLPCQGSTCTPAATEAGAPCQFASSRDSDPGIFAQRPRCIDGEYCNGTTCVPPGGPDAGCAYDEDCAKGLYCNAPFGGACAPIVQADAGGGCIDDRFCAADLSCQNGDCTARKPAGASCTDALIGSTECDGYCAFPTPDASVGTCHTFCGSQ